MRAHARTHSHGFEYVMMVSAAYLKTNSERERCVSVRYKMAVRAMELRLSLLATNHAMLQMINALTTGRLRLNLNPLNLVR